MRSNASPFFLCFSIHIKLHCARQKLPFWSRHTFFLCICFVNFRFNTISIFLASFFLAVGLVLFCFYWCGSCLRAQMCNKAKITEILFSVNRRGNLREKVCNLCEHKKRIPFIFTLFLCSAPIHFERSQKRCYFVRCSLCNAI